MAKWYEDVAKALAALGGEAELDAIYEAVENIRRERLPANWQAIIRKELALNSSDSLAHAGERDLFYSAEGIGKAVWGLRGVTPASPLFGFLGPLPQPLPKSWRDDVFAALENLGGQGALEEIYDAVANIRSAPLPANWQAIIRKELEIHSTDSQAFRGEAALYQSVDGIGKGVWALSRNAHQEFAGLFNRAAGRQADRRPRPHRAPRLGQAARRLT